MAAVRRLDPRGVPDTPTYPEVGSTAGELPAGYRVVEVSRRLPAGADFSAAVEDLMRWRVHERAGFRVSASTESAVPGSVVVLRLGLVLRIPCRVIYTVDEPDRRGFAYGTLPGNPVSGEEAFLLHRGADGRVTFRITAFSRPASLLARASGPVGRGFQDFMTRRYLKGV